MSEQGFNVTHRQWTALVAENEALKKKAVLDSDLIERATETINRLIEQANLGSQKL